MMRALWLILGCLMLACLLYTSPDGLYLSAIEYPDEFGLDELDGGAVLLAPFTQAPGSPS